MNKKPLNEKSMQELEKSIPLLASGAVTQARIRALAAGQTVLMVADGWLVEQSPDGSIRKLRELPPGRAVKPGTHRRITR